MGRSGDERVVRADREDTGDQDGPLAGTKELEVRSGENAQCLKEFKEGSLSIRSHGVSR